MADVVSLGLCTLLSVANPFSLLLGRDDKYLSDSGAEVGEEVLSVTLRSEAEAARQLVGASPVYNHRKAELT